MTITIPTSRVDPYKNFKFLIKWKNSSGTHAYVAGMSKMSSLKRTTQVVTHRSGGDHSTSHKSPGNNDYAAIEFGRGLTQDREFEAWANLCWNYKNQLGTEVSLANFRKELRIEVLNEAGEVALAYHVHRCWISEYQALPDFDANANAVAIENIKVENEGWERVDVQGETQIV